MKENAAQASFWDRAVRNLKAGRPVSASEPDSPQIVSKPADGPAASDVSTVATRRTEERFAVRYLIDFRGASLARSLITGSGVSVNELWDVYAGKPVRRETMEALKKVLKERLTRT